MLQQATNFSESPCLLLLMAHGRTSLKHCLPDCNLLFKSANETSCCMCMRFAKALKSGSECWVWLQGGIFTENVDSGAGCGWDWHMWKLKSPKSCHEHALLLAWTQQSTSLKPFQHLVIPSSAAHRLQEPTSDNLAPRQPCLVRVTYFIRSADCRKPFKYAELLMQLFTSS